MSITRFSLGNRVLVNLLFVLGAVAGALAFSGNQIDVYPNVSFDAGQVLVVWPGASPEEVEASITRKVEEEIDDIPGIDRIVSYSERDRSLIDVKFREDLTEDEFQANFAELRAGVQRVTGLPADAEPPHLRKISVNELYPLLQVVVTSTTGADASVLRAVARDLRQELRAIPGVSKVGDLGILEAEWHVRARRGALDAAGLTLLDLATRLKERHRNLPSGTLRSEHGEFSVSATGEFTSLQGLGKLAVGMWGDSSPVLLDEVADITSGFERPTHANRFNGHPCINLSIAKETDQDALTLRDEITTVLDRFRARGLPAGTEITTTVDTTRIIRNRVKILVDNLAFGVVLVFLVLWAFLGARNSLLAIVGIPFSFLVSMILLGHLGITINAISLFSLMLVSGMVVDDAIVVLENIYRRLEAGDSKESAVTSGTDQVFWPVTSSTLTTVAAFLPMLIMEGVVGEFMSIIPKTVMAVLLASLIECLLILPVHYLHFGSTPRQRRRESLVDRGLVKLGALYGRVLGGVMRHPWCVVGGVILLAVLAGFIGQGLPVNLFPSDFQAFYCNIAADGEYSLETTAEAVRGIEALIEEYMPTQVESYTTSLGAAFTEDSQLILKPSVAQILVYMSDTWSKDNDATALISDVRRRVSELVAKKGRYRFLHIKVDAFQDGPPVGKPVAVRVQTPDYAAGKRVALEIREFLATLPGVISIADNLSEGPREASFRPIGDRLDRERIPFESVAQTVLIANEGLEIGDLLPPGSDDEVTLRLQLAERDRLDPAALMLLQLRAPSGRLVPLGDVLETKMTRGPSSLYHWNGARTVLVTADVDSKVTDSAEVNRALMERFANVPLDHPGVSLQYGGEFEETQKSFGSLKKAFVISVFLIFTILAVQFRSYRLPFIVIVVVPFSFVGVVLGLWIIGSAFTILAFIAIVGLSGVVVNDSLVLVEFIRQRHSQGSSLVDAVRGACLARLRAVLLTTITTVFGLLPMALGFTGHSLVWSPFAATITFGLTLAMFLTLLLVPATYVLVHRGREGRHGAKPAPENATE